MNDFIKLSRQQLIMIIRLSKLEMAAKIDAQPVIEDLYQDYKLKKGATKIIKTYNIKRIF